jgi:hypothetical protein
VSASEVARTLRIERDRRLRTIFGSFKQMWQTKPAMNTHAPK